MSEPRNEPLSAVARYLNGWDERPYYPSDDLPTFWDGLPRASRLGWIASGELMIPLPYESPRLGPLERIGGGRVLRLDLIDAKPVNCDDYVFARNKTNPERIWVEKLRRHPNEHHATLDEVARFLSVEVIY